jgi:hypothetical protein
MSEPAVNVMPADEAAKLAEFARACKAAARAVSLYPGAHPAIGASLGRLADLTARLTQAGPYKLQVAADRLLFNGAGAAKPDPAIAELASLLHRHVIGSLTLNSGADAGSWRTLLLLLARAPEDVRADGGIARLWTTAGGPSLEIQEIDYAEVLREKQGAAAGLDQIIAAALSGPQLTMDDGGMRLLLDIVGDPARLSEMMQKLGSAVPGNADAQTMAFLNLMKGLAEWTGRNQPARLDDVVGQMSQAAGHLSADAMIALLAQGSAREKAGPGGAVAAAVLDRMTDQTVSHFVAGAVIEERGASDRLAQAFQALVPDTERRRQLLALAQEEVSASALGEEQNFGELWERVERLLTSYSDKTFVSDEYGRELSAARLQAVDVERISDDPPERLAGWLATVSDAALRSLDHQLLVDLLTIEGDPLRWRDVADTVIAHADDLVRVGHFGEAWRLVNTVLAESEKGPARRDHAASALERFARGSMLKHVASHLRNADEETFERFKTLCHEIGPSIIGPLAEVLTAEQDARSRRRLRDILLGFGARGRASVQQLMNAPNWEVRRTAAFLLREFGGAEGLKELVPLLSDNEPLVQREAIQGLLMNSSEEASRILLDAIRKTTGRAHETLLNELSTIRDERAAPHFRYLIRHLDRRKHPRLYLSSIEAVGASSGAESVETLKVVLYQGSWTAPLETRRVRSAAASALRRIGSAQALEVLREASQRAPRGVRSAAREALAELG